MASIDPLGWLVSLAGCVYDWLLSRSWVQILVRTVPVIALGLLVLVVWLGGRVDKSKLADRYLELGSPRIAEWEDQLFDKLTSTRAPEQPQETTDALAASPDVAPPDQEKPAETDRIEPAPSYEAMLYRRVQLIRKDNQQSRFVTGTNLLLNGAVANAQKVLREIAPDDSEGLPKAHAMMALSYLNQYSKSRAPELVARLQHHSELAVKWPNTPKDILMLAGELNWQRGNPNRAIEIFQLATERFPEIYPLLLERANQVGNTELAATAREKATIHFEGLLNSDPKNDSIRIQLAQLLGASDESLNQVERLLREGLELGESKNLSRALSEVYRIRFVKMYLEKQGKPDDFTLLQTSLDIDPTNPLVAEHVSRMIRDGVRPPRELQNALKEMLTSGEATAVTHAMMSEYYLAANRSSEAIMHLEKVFQAAPLQVKYANNLAYLYAEAGRMEEAEQTARKCLELLQRANLQAQPFVDELLDTLGMIYQKQEKNSDAISSYELALRFNPERVDSRERLAAIYRSIGNEGVASAHEQAIEAIKKSQQEKAQSERAQSEKAQQEAAEQSPRGPLVEEPTAESP